MESIVLKRARSAAKSMTREMFAWDGYGNGYNCPRCLAGHIVPVTRAADTEWEELYDNLCPVPERLPPHDSLGGRNLTPHAARGHANARRVLAYLIRTCRKYQRRRRMAIVRDLLKQDMDRQQVRMEQRAKRRAAGVGR